MHMNEKWKLPFGLCWRGVWSAALIIACQMVSYVIGQQVVHLFGLPTHTLALAWDEQIPFVPAFLVPYLGCFVHWLVTFYLIAGKEQRFARFFTAAVAGYGVSMLVFILWPTTIQRPDPQAAGWWGWLYAMVCGVDQPLNLFPSVHCFAAWMCYLGVRGQKDIAAWFRWFTLALAVVVFTSTVLVKQHYLLDIAGGVALAQICWLLAGWEPLHSLGRRVARALPQ